MPQVFVLVEGVPLSATRAMTRINVIRMSTPNTMSKRNLFLGVGSMGNFILRKRIGGLEKR